MSVYEKVGTLNLFRKTPIGIPGKIWTTSSSSESQWFLAQASISYLLPSQLFTASIEFSFTDITFNVICIICVILYVSNFLI